MRTSFSRKSLYSERGCWKKPCSGGFVLSCRRVCWLPVGQSSCGGCSGRENRKKRNTHDKTSKRKRKKQGGFHRALQEFKGGNSVNQFVKHLKRCAVCGSIPKIHYVYEHGHHYKLFCPKNAVHNSTGEWFANKYKACQDWNRRQQALEEKEKTFGDNLKPCPFCGRKMQFHNDVRLDRNGKRRNYLYFLHEDYDINKEVSCILDDICMPFSIGAGDANVEKGYISRWNEPWNCSNSETRNWNRRTRS